jgi:hypothetical protein
VWPLTPGKTWEDRFTQELPLDHKTIEFARRCRRQPGSIGSEIWYAPEIKQCTRERGPSDYGIRERELISFKLD